LKTGFKTLERFVKEGKTRFYLNEFVEDANITTRQAEDFFLPLLRKSKLEGELEVRCPNCGKDIGIYDKMSQIPEQIECEICGCSFGRSSEYIEIILEVKGEFFRGPSYSPNSGQKTSNKRRPTQIAAGCH